MGTTQRQWDPTVPVYRSSNNYDDPRIIYGRHPTTGKLFVVFLNTTGVLHLRPGEVMKEVWRANSLFLETVNGTRGPSHQRRAGYID